jgi:nitrogen fixation protein FixH
MKNLAIILLTIFLMTGVAFAKNFEATKKAGEFDVTLSIDKNPPVVGDNAVTIAVKDATGKPVTDAKVLLDYSMPAMPGMPAMNYKADALLKGTDYQTTINLPASGAWNIALKITRNGSISTARFNVEAH